MTSPVHSRLKAMLVLVLVLVLAAPVFVHWVVAQPAFAQQASDQAAENRAKRWQSFFDGTQKLLADPAATVAALDLRREQLQDIARQILDASGVAANRLKDAKGLLAALGPAPKAGAPREPAAAAERRADLTARAAQAEAQAKVLAVTEKEASGLLSRMDDHRNTLIARRLLREGPSIWASGTWTIARRDLSRLWRDLAEDVAAWWQAVRRAVSQGTARVILTALLIGLLAWLALYLRGWVLDKWGRRRRKAAPSNARDITTATLAIAMASGLLPAALVLGAYLYLRGQGLAEGDFHSIIQGAALAAGVYILFWAFSRAVFAPIVVGWRPLPLTDRQARRLHRWVRLLGATLSIGLFAGIAARPHFISREILAVWTLVVAAPAAVLMLFISRLRNWEIVELEETLDPRPPMLRGSRLLLKAGAVAVLVALALDYHRFAEFVLIGTLATVGILIAARLLRRFSFDALKLILHIEADEATPRLGQFWFALLADIALAIGAGFVLMLVWSVDIDSLGRLLTNLWSGMKVGNYTISLGDILFGVLIFAILVTLVRSTQRSFDERIKTGTRLDPGVRNALRAGLGYGGFVVAAAIAITVAGFDLSNLAIIAGALSVGIGFGLQAIVNNFVSGLILLVERPIKEGDWIIAGDQQGVVRKIGIRATEVRTFQNASVIIPNAKLISDPVTNWLFKDRTGRGEIRIGVAYGSDTAKVKEILLEAAKAHPKVRPVPPPSVLFKDFGDSALIFDLRFYLSDMYDVITVPSDIRFDIDQRFRAENVEIPFPQRDLHIRSPIPVPLKTDRQDDSDGG